MINEALAAGEVRTRLLELGVQPLGGTPEAFRARFMDDLERFRRIVDAAGIRPE